MQSRYPLGYCGYTRLFQRPWFREAETGGDRSNRTRHRCAPALTCGVTDVTDVTDIWRGQGGCNRSNLASYRTAPALTCGVTDVTDVTDIWRGSGRGVRPSYDSGRMATKVPRPCMTTSKPSPARLAIARRTVARATPYTSTARSCSAGNRLLAGSAPLRMSAVMSSAICCQTNRGPS